MEKNNYTEIVDHIQVLRNIHFLAAWFPRSTQELQSWNFNRKRAQSIKSNHLHCLPYKVFRKIIFSNSNVSLFQLIIFSLLHTVHDRAIVSCSIVKYICPIALLRVLTCSVLPAIVLVVVVLTFHKTTKQNHSKPPLERIVWKQQQTSSRWRKSSITFGRLKERAMERKSTRTGGLPFLHCPKMHSIHPECLAQPVHRLLRSVGNKNKPTGK